MKKILAYAALTGAGKTTVFNPVLEEKGYKVISPSLVVHDVTKSVVDGLTNSNIDTQLKTAEYAFYLLGHSRREFNRRELLTSMAEVFLKPVLGEDCIERAAARKVVKALEITDKVAYEIYAPAWDYFLCALSEFYMSDESVELITLNINVSHKIEIGTDKRHLLPDSDLTYNAPVSSSPQFEFIDFLNTHGL